MTSIRPSDLTLGIMRLDVETRTVADWAAFFVEAHDLGVKWLHVSDEYDSWPLFLEIWTEACRISPTLSFKFIAKLGEPHFDQPEFSAKRLQRRIEEYCEHLSIERLDDVQWMWRAGLEDDDRRCSAFTAQSPAIGDCVTMLKSKGKIGRFLCFPYSPAFAGLALDQDFVDGLAVYRNSLEREYEVHLDQCRARSKMVHIIRPFLGGGTLKQNNIPPRQQLIKALDHPAIETAILSTGNMAHLRALLA
jgi:aryl-alcohol dehydrogenase-like predicted oxidoreductase